MTEEFKLRDGWTSLHICGMNFDVELCSSTANACGNILQDAKRLLQKVKSPKDSGNVSDDEISSFFKKSIDSLLGNGAVDKIFLGRSQEMCDLADLMCFVVSKIKDGFSAGVSKRKRKIRNR
jgi:hypothetical protein